jgi:hypothetical protein
MSALTEADLDSIKDLPDPRILPILMGGKSYYVIGVHRTHMIDCLQPGWSLRAVESEEGLGTGFQVFNIDEACV